MLSEARSTNINRVECREMRTHTKVFSVIRTNINRVECRELHIYQSQMNNTCTNINRVECRVVRSCNKSASSFVLI